MKGFLMSRSRKLGMLGGCGTVLGTKRTHVWQWKGSNCCGVSWLRPLGQTWRSLPVVGPLDTLEVAGVLSHFEFSGYRRDFWISASAEMTWC